MAKDDDLKRENETVKVAKAAKAAKESAEKSATSWKRVAGIGIGSAAVVAALIYANRARKKDD